MNRVIKLLGHRADLVVIRRGTIVQSRTLSDIGRVQFNVDLLEADGGEIGLWSGSD